MAIKTTPTRQAQRDRPGTQDGHGGTIVVTKPCHRIFIAPKPIIDAAKKMRPTDANLSQLIILSSDLCRRNRCS